jgi:hypothetical protein
MVPEAGTKSELKQWALNNIWPHYLTEVRYVVRKVDNGFYYAIANGWWRVEHSIWSANLENSAVFKWKSGWAALRAFPPHVWWANWLSWMGLSWFRRFRRYEIMQVFIVYENSPLYENSSSHVVELQTLKGLNT